MGEEIAIGLTNARQPLLCPSWPPVHALEFATCPADQVSVDTMQDRMEGRSIEVAVVVDPAANMAVVQLGQILQGFVTPMVETPPPECLTHGLQRFWADSRQEGDHISTTPSPDRFSRAESIA